MSKAPDCQRCPELEHELRERDGAIRVLEEERASADDYNAFLRAWVGSAPHKPGCGRTYGLRHCNCGKDVLCPPDKPAPVALDFFGASNLSIAR